LDTSTHCLRGWVGPRNSRFPLFPYFIQKPHKNPPQNRTKVTTLQNMLKRQEIPYYTSIMFIYKRSKCKVSENTQPEVIGKQMRLTINNLLNETKFIQRNIYKNKYQEVEP